MELPEKIISQVKTCAFCYLMCRHYCTIASVQRINHSTPRGKALILHEILGKRLEMNEESARLFYMCTNCGRCYVACETKASNPPEIFEEVRHFEVSNNISPREIVEVAENIIETGNPYGLRGDRLIDGGLVDESLFENKSKYLYYIGGEIRAAHPEIAQKTIRLLGEIGIGLRVMRDEPDDGAFLYILGFRDAAKKAADNLLRRLKEEKVKDVIVSDPLSYAAFKVYYPKLGISSCETKVMHVTELLRENDKFKSLKKELKSSTVYHDPCFLGRRSTDLYDPSRELLKQIYGLELKEPWFSKEHAFCCGGMLRPIDEYWAGKVAERLAKEFKSLNVDFVTTSCPRCKDSLNRVGVKAYDIAEILEMILPKRD